MGQCLARSAKVGAPASPVESRVSEPVCRDRQGGRGGPPSDLLFVTGVGEWRGKWDIAERRGWGVGRG